MTDPDASPDYDVGYSRTPAASRFQKGRSGNPKGRPRGSKQKRAPFDAVLGQRVTIREDGCERRVTAAEAFLLHMTKRGLEGDGAAARAALTAIAEARALRPAEQDRVTVIIVKPVAPGSVNSALEPLRMATKLDRYRSFARMMLEPWLVQAALARLGSQRLSVEDQRKIVAVTRSPNKVRWPKWWTVSSGRKL